MAAGEIIWTEDTIARVPGEDPVRRFVGAWESNGSGAASGDTPELNGTIVGVIFDPGSPAPDANYDVVGNHENGVDCFGGVGANLSATVATQEVPLTAVNSMPFVVASVLSVAVSGAGNAKQGQIIILVR